MEPGVHAVHVGHAAQPDERVSLGGATGRYLRVQLPGNSAVLDFGELWIDGHAPAAGPQPLQTVSARTSSSGEDAEERLGTAAVVLTSPDLELGVAVAALPAS